MIRHPDEPMSPACAGCREPRGTCFPGPCKIYHAGKAAREARAEAAKPLLLDLARRCERGGEGDQANLLNDVWDLLAEHCPSFRRFTSATAFGPHNNAGAFGMAMDARAYLSAAEMLVPEEWFWRVGHGTANPGWAHLNRVHPDHCDRQDEHNGEGLVPALALAAAALRAWDAIGGAA